jgi:hypothetical protein
MLMFAKRSLLRLVGKTILVISPVIWKIPGKFAFDLHQKLGLFAFELHRQHNLDLWDEKL